MKDITIPAATAEILIKEQGNAARLYILYIGEGSLEPDAACARLGMSRAAFDAAVAALSRHGLYKPKDTGAHREIREPRMPEYTEDEVSGALKDDKNFRGLLDFAEDKFGRVLSYNDGVALLRIYRWMGLPCEVIAMLLSYAASVAEAKQAGKRPSMNEVQKLAIMWDKNDITDVEKADKFMRDATERTGFAHEVRRALGVPSLTPIVEQYINDWRSWGMTVPLIARAADLTVTKIGQMKFSYMNSILRDWHDKGITNVDEIAQKDKPSSRQYNARTRDDAVESTPEIEAIRSAKERRRAREEDRKGE